MKFEIERGQSKWIRESIGYLTAYFIFVALVFLIVKIVGLSIDVFMVASIILLFLLVGNLFRMVSK